MSEQPREGWGASSVLEAWRASSVMADDHPSITVMCEKSQRTREAKSALALTDRHSSNRSGPVTSPRQGVAGKIDSVRRQRYHERMLLVPPTNTGSN